MSQTMMTSKRMRKFATFNTKQCNKLTGKKWKLSSALKQPKMSIFFLQVLYARLYHTTTIFFTITKDFVNFNFFTPPFWTAWHRILTRNCSCEPVLSFPHYAALYFAYCVKAQCCSRYKNQPNNDFFFPLV